MPLYEYKCDACGERFEKIQKYSDVTETCAHCGKGPVHRLHSSPAIQFKGSGFYITDYAQKGKSGGESGSSSGKSDSGEKSSTSEKSDTGETKKSDSGSGASSSSSGDTSSKSESSSTASAPKTTTSSKD